MNADELKALPPCTSATTRADIGGLPPRVGHPIAIGDGELGTVPAVSDPRVEWMAKEAKRWRATGDKTLIFVHQRDTLEALPGTGRLAILNSILPGASLTNSTEKSAGGNDRTQTRFSLHGAPEAQPYIDGINQQIPGITIGVFV